MEKYIPKSALVEEIERLKTVYNDDENILHVAKYNILIDILSFLDTLKVEEVDLEKEINLWFDYGFPNDEELLDYIKETAKHFFELGIKVQKGE